MRAEPYRVSHIGTGRGGMRSLLFLLLVLFSMLAPVSDDDRHHNLDSDVERYLRGETAGKNMEDDLQKFSN
jgi:hypothetical protein